MSSLSLVFVRRFATLSKRSIVKAPPPPSSSDPVLRGNRQTQRQNSGIFRERVAERKRQERAAAESAKLLSAEQQRVNQQKIIAQNEEYRAMLARKALNDKRKEERSLERQRAHGVRRQILAQRLSDYRTNTTKFFNAKERVMSETRREYLRLLNEDVSQFERTPDELDYARFLIANPERFNLFNN